MSEEKKFKIGGRPYGIKRDVKLTTTPPVVQTFHLAREIFEKSLNKYQLYREMERADAELYADIQDFAHTVRTCYAGISIETGEQLDAREKKLLESAKFLAKKFKFQSRFFTIGKHVVRDGNCVYVLDPRETLVIDGGASGLQLAQIEQMPDKMVQELQMLPMPYLTAVDLKRQIGQVTGSDVSGNIQVYDGNYYILNEQTADKRRVYTKNRILHFKLEEEGEEVSDLLGRYTFGVWSTSPLLPLKLTVLYKRSSTLDDMAWRHKMLPREQHLLPMDAFMPENFEGDTPEEQMAAAKTAAQTEFLDYATQMKEIQSDENYITPDTIKIEMIEPRSTTYKDPNQLIDQQNRTIHRALGLPPMTGDSTASYAYGLIVSSYATVRAKNVAEHIKSVFEPFLRSQLILWSKAGNFKQDGAMVVFTEEDVEKVNIKLQLILDKDRFELVRQASMMSQMDCYTRQEIRDTTGHGPLDDKELPNVVRAPAANIKTPAEVGVDEYKRGSDRGDPGHPSTPVSREATRRNE